MAKWTSCSNEDFSSYYSENGGNSNQFCLEPFIRDSENSTSSSTDIDPWDELTTAEQLPTDQITVQTTEYLSNENSSFDQNTEGEVEKSRIRSPFQSAKI